MYFGVTGRDLAEVVSDHMANNIGTDQHVFHFICFYAFSSAPISFPPCLHDKQGMLPETAVFQISKQQRVSVFCVTTRSPTLRVPAKSRPSRKRSFFYVAYFHLIVHFGRCSSTHSVEMS
jgi:hypothetical protein